MIFKATVLGAAASILAFGAAAAADLPSYKAPPPPPPPPVFNWTSYHVGVSGGYGGGSANYLSNVQTFGVGPALNWSAPSSSGTSGFLVGIESGATWHLPNNFVIGYESEFNYADVSSNSSGVWGGAMNSRLKWFGAERLRFGYAFGRILPYITGGLSYAQMHVNGVDNIGGFLFPTHSSNWQAGWNVGGGVEYAFLDNMSVKAEYLYSSLRGPHGAGLGFPTAYRTFVGNGFDTHIARVGINYRFKTFGTLIGRPDLGI